MMSYRLFIILFLFFISLSLKAGTELSRSKWKELKEDIQYKKADEKGNEAEFDDWAERISRMRARRNIPDRETLPVKTRDEEQDDDIDLPGVNIPDWLIYVAYILVALVLIIVIIVLLRQYKKQVNKKIITEENEETSIEKPFDELEEMLQKYIHEGNYREAVRVHFIYIIKTLREKGWIVWELKKTNSAYLFEMRNRSQAGLFSQVTLLFEMVWYGKREPDKEQYNKLRPLFDSLLNSIRQSNE